MKHSPQTERIAAMVGPAIEALGFALVRVRITAQRGEQILQIMAEPKDGREMTVEDCAQISRHLSAILDVEDPISSAYRLEISSPGIDRPLLTVQEFNRYIGHEAQIEMEWPVTVQGKGRKRFKGEIIRAEGDEVELQLDAQNNAVLEISAMQSAKLILTDKLIKEHLQKRQAS